MKQPIREMAERYARACGWTYHECVRDHGTWGLLLEPGCWKDANDKWVVRTVLSNMKGYDDHHFWRPRLEDRLCAIVEEKFNHMAKVELHLKEELCAVRVRDMQHSGYPYFFDSYKPICEALCEAIEKLTEKELVCEKCGENINPHDQAYTGNKLCTKCTINQ